MHGTLMQFNCQPVEKKNHWQSQAFHRGSQKSVRTFRLWQIIQLFSSTVALFTNASRNCVNFVSAMLIEHRPLPTLYQKSCIIFTDIPTANYILEIGRWIANLPEKMENEFTSVLLLISITFTLTRATSQKWHYFAKIRMKSLNTKSVRFA